MQAKVTTNAEVIQNVSSYLLQGSSRASNRCFLIKRLINLMEMEENPYLFMYEKRVLPVAYSLLEEPKIEIRHLNDELLSKLTRTLGQEKVVSNASHLSGKTQAKLLGKLNLL